MTTTVQDRVTTSPPISTPSLRSRIIGTWDLVHYIGTNIENPEDIMYPLGKDARGQIMYSNDGYMSALLQVGDLTPFEKGWNNGTTEEWAIAAQCTMAYAGPFYLDEAPGKPQTIVHHAQISIHPNLIDTLQVRCAEIIQEDGHDYIVLGPELPTDWEGSKRLLRLKWRKRPQNNATRPPPEAKELKL
ncbi:hypothetical protein H2200_011145 [Cladophialophora chaetospira]|uniref:Lipocalin-like domain-containing protein n=1 Tax=Cladophialophora chaetospira TaxID=386627 RepID=A0AA39CDI6_9EURO|nr:hypothetical protein H2200_011145 [Cladophialophora chaetospira]